MRRVAFTLLLPLLAIGLLAGCKPVSSVSTDGGAGTIYVGWHPPIHPEGVGEWERNGSKKGLPIWAWAAMGAAAGTAGGAAAPKGVANAGANAVLDFVGSPCRDSDGLHRPGHYKLVSWVTSLPTSIVMGQRRNPNPFLDCAGLKGILHRKMPGRLQNMYDCIGFMLKNGNPVWSTVRNAVVWSYKDGMVAVTKSGRVLTASPEGGSWGKCAKDALK